MMRLCHVVNHLTYAHKIWVKSFQVTFKACVDLNGLRRRVLTPCSLIGGSAVENKVLHVPPTQGRSDAA
jgi:hypothetical protein